MASSLKSRRGPMGPLFATDRYCDFDPVDRAVYTCGFIVRFLLALLGFAPISFELHLPFGALVLRSELVAVENLPSISVNMLDVAGDDPDLRISWCA
jgi:hypothetical protein